MALGLGLLRMAPRDFWSMTPRELAAAMRPPQAPDAPGRDALAGMMAAFPDRRRQD
jgi:uncharacterized phage protein (TIGR02216 family)